MNEHQAKIALALLQSLRRPRTPSPRDSVRAVTYDFEHWQIEWFEGDFEAALPQILTEPHEVALIVANERD